MFCGRSWPNDLPSSRPTTAFCSLHKSTGTFRMRAKPRPLSSSLRMPWKSCRSWGESQSLGSNSELASSSCSGESKMRAVASSSSLLSLRDSTRSQLLRSLQASSAVHAAASSTCRCAAPATAKRRKALVGRGEVGFGLALATAPRRKALSMSFWQ